MYPRLSPRDPVHSSAAAWRPRMIAGVPLELRVWARRSVRHGESVFQLSNAPYTARVLRCGSRLELFSGLASGASTSAPVSRRAPEAFEEPIPAMSRGRGGPTADSRVPAQTGSVACRDRCGTRGRGPRYHQSPDRSARKRRTSRWPCHSNWPRSCAERGAVSSRCSPAIRDVFVEVMERPSLAVDWEADLFMSIHVDAQPRPGSSARGFTTYHLGQARTADALAVARRENAVIELEDGTEPPNVDQLEIILATVDRDAYRRESRILAGHVSERFAGRAGQR